MERITYSKSLFRPIRGLWWLSGYVLTPRGATKLLDALPIKGPVDQWMNHQFGRLDVYALSTPSNRPAQAMEVRQRVLDHSGATKP